MKNIILYSLMIGVLCLGCNDRINDTPIFEYDCVDTSFHYNSSNILTDRNIRYTKNNLFVRSSNIDGNVVYINYDSKNRIIKDGNIYNGEHFFIEYIYGALDTISEVRYSDNRKYQHEYNNERKIIKIKYFENNILIDSILFFYNYFEDVEMVKTIFDIENIVYTFNIKNNADIPVSLDTIKNYSLWYKSGNRLDSMFIFQNNLLTTKSLNIYNSFNEPTYKEYSIYSTYYNSKEIRKWEYTPTNKVRKYIEEYENSLMSNLNYYTEQILLYNELDDVIKNEVYDAAGTLVSYAIISEFGLNTFHHWYDANDIFLGYSKYTPYCLDYMKSRFYFEGINENESDFIKKENDFKQLELPQTKILLPH